MLARADRAVAENMVFVPFAFVEAAANILTNPLRVLAPALCALVAPGGRIALSGILESQTDQVIEAYAPWISLHVGKLREGWARLEGVRA